MKAKDLQREEARGVFAIGVIAALFTINQLYGKVKIFDVAFELLTAFLLFCWLLYILLIAIGISEDIFGPATSDLCLAGGRFMFMAGATGSAVLFISAPIFYFRDHGMTLPYYAGFSLLILIFAYVFIRLGFLKLLKDSLKTSKKRRR